MNGQQAIVGVAAGEAVGDSHVMLSIGSAFGAEGEFRGAKLTPAVARVVAEAIIEALDEVGC